MNYKEYIDNILALRENVKQEGLYMERHHIIPKCMGGSNKEENLIWLTPSEHYIAHKMLMEENPKNKKLAYAFSRMAFSCSYKDMRGDFMTPSEYEEARILFAKMCSGENNSNYGNKWTEEQKKLLSKKIKELGIKPSKEHIEKLKLVNSHPFTDEHKRKISESRIKGGYCGEKAPWFGKKHTEEYKEKMRAMNLGKNNPMYGKTLSKERREEISKKSSKKIIVVETGLVFDSIKKAQEYFGKPKGTNIIDVLRGHQKSFKGFHFEYYKGDLA